MRQDVPALSALNMRLRDDFTDDCDRRPRPLEQGDRDAPAWISRLKLPHVAFNRRIGEFARTHTDLDGVPLSAEEWARRRDSFLPTAGDAAYLDSLMKPVLEPGKFADWIAPPKVGIDSKPGEFEYVKIHE